jgi:ABC-type Fe3+ transport system permease subunit
MGIQPTHLCIILIVLAPFVVVAAIAIRAGKRGLSQSERPSGAEISDSEIQSISKKQRWAIIVAVVSLLVCCVTPTASKAIENVLKQEYVQKYGPLGAELQWMYSSTSLVLNWGTLIVIFVLFGLFFYSLARIWFLNKRRKLHAPKVVEKEKPTNGEPKL